MNEMFPCLGVPSCDTGEVGGHVNKIGHELVILAAR